MGNRGWIGVDLDRTLARYDNWEGPDHIGEPVPLMVKRVQKWLTEGKDVRIFTARVTHNTSSDPEKRREQHLVRSAIQRWSQEQFGKILPITCVKDYGMIELWDDRAVQIIPNTGIRVDTVGRNYMTDDPALPQWVQFGNGRTVRVTFTPEGYAHLEISG